MYIFQDLVHFHALKNAKKFQLRFSFDHYDLFAFKLILSVFALLAILAISIIYSLPDAHKDQVVPPDMLNDATASELCFKERQEINLDAPVEQLLHMPPVCLF